MQTAKHTDPKSQPNQNFVRNNSYYIVYPKIHFQMKSLNLKGALKGHGSHFAMPSHLASQHPVEINYYIAPKTSLMPTFIISFTLDQYQQ